VPARRAARARWWVRVRRPDRRWRDPPPVHPGRREGRARDDGPGRRLRLPGRRRQGDVLRPQVQSRRLVRDELQDGRLDRLQGRDGEGRADPARADQRARRHRAGDEPGRHHGRPPLADGGPGPVHPQRLALRPGARAPGRQDPQAGGGGRRQVAARTRGAGMRKLAVLVTVALVAIGLTGCSTWWFADQGKELRAGSPLVLPVVVAKAGEGVVQLTMSGPGTDWVSSSATSVVVDAQLDGLPAQSFVLYAGAEPYPYSGFTGAIAAGAHRLTLTVRGDLSAPPRADAVALLQRASLDVVTPNEPGYLALAHAPVVYGRSVNAHSDTPLLAYARQTALGGGATKLSYTQFWSNEDAGTGVLPFLLWSEYGRTTDIETSIELTLAADGTVTNAIYQTCAACPPNFPENQTGLDHSYEPFTGQYFAGTHPILRVSTGNNVFSEVGTTP